MKVRVHLRFKKKIASQMGAESLFDEVKNASEDVAVLTVEGLVDLLKEKRSFYLSQDVAMYLRFVGFADGVLKVNLEEGAPRDLIRKLNSFFENNKYKIKVECVDERGEDTLEQKKKALFEQQLKEVSQNPILKEILECFSNSVVANIEDL